jgi:protein O-GlcNAc transferase
MPTLARAHFNRGNILLDRGDAQDALDAYEEAIKYKPDSAAAHFNMATPTCASEHRSRRRGLPAGCRH